MSEHSHWGRLATLAVLERLEQLERPKRHLKSSSVGGSFHQGGQGRYGRDALTCEQSADRNRIQKGMNELHLSCLPVG